MSSQEKSQHVNTLYLFMRLKDLARAHYYEVKVPSWLNVFIALKNPLALWGTLNYETIQTALECAGERPKSKSDFTA